MVGVARMEGGVVDPSFCPVRLARYRSLEWLALFERIGGGRLGRVLKKGVCLCRVYRLSSSEAL